MATAKKAAAPVAKKTRNAAAAPAPAAKKGVAARKGAAVKPEAVIKPIKAALNKTGLIAHLAEQSQVEPKAVKAVMAALESAMLASLHKKGHGEFTLHGLLKVTAASVPAKKKRFGKDPFSGEERWFAAKPASTRIRTRALKKLKDAAL